MLNILINYISEVVEGKTKKKKEKEEEAEEGRGKEAEDEESKDKGGENAESKGAEGEAKESKDNEGKGNESKEKEVSSASGAQKCDAKAEEANAAYLQRLTDDAEKSLRVGAQLKALGEADMASADTQQALDEYELIQRTKDATLACKSVFWAQYETYK